MANHNSNLNSGVGSNSKEQIKQKEQRVRNDGGAGGKLNGRNRPAE